MNPMSVLAKPEELRIDLPLGGLADYCRRWKITRLEVFGSVLREDFTPASDIDFLYTLAPDARWGWEFCDATDELAALVGRKVDLVSRDAVERSRNWIRRRAILQAARIVYVA